MSKKCPDAHGFRLAAAHEGTYALLSMSFDPDKDCCVLTCDDHTTGSLTIFVLPANKDLRTLWVTTYGFCQHLTLHVQNCGTQTRFQVTHGGLARAAASISLDTAVVQRGVYVSDAKASIALTPGRPLRIVGVAIQHKHERPPGLVLMSDEKRPMLVYVPSALTRTKEWTETIAAPPSHVLQFRRNGTSYEPVLQKSR